MKNALLSAVSILALSFQLGCGQVAPSDSEVAGAKGCSSAPTLKLPKATGFGFLAFEYNGFVGHRARDVIAVRGQDAILHAKFTYGLADKDMKGQPVDIYLSTGCTSAFQKIGSVRTSNEDNDSLVIENIKDSGGRIFTKLSDLGVRNLPLGRHRVRFVVPADNSSTDAFIDVIERSQKIVVSDIDGTLTESEFAAVKDILQSTSEYTDANILKFKGSKANPGAAAVLTALKAKGYKIFYLTARPEWLMPITRKWLADNKFPEGTIHTTDKKTGAQGEAAMEYKIKEIALLKAQTGIVPTYAFGNKESDVQAFGQSGIAPKNSYYIKLEGDAKGGVVHTDYNAILPVFKSNALSLN